MEKIFGVPRYFLVANEVNATGWPAMNPVSFDSVKLECDPYSRIPFLDGILEVFGACKSPVVLTDRALNRL